MERVDGIAAVTARIGEIQGLMAALAPPRAMAAPTASRGDFASTLALARSAGAASPASAASSPTAVGSTARTASGAPAALAAYGNGKIPAAALTPLGHGDHRLWAPAAEAFRAMEQAAAKDGVTLKVTDSYRSYEGQVDVARRKGLYAEGGLAAKPGTSEHGWGLSVDLSLDGRAQSWMRTHGARFGFEENVPREPWHWTFTSGR
jgi:D-alanyl-D-alanine carboxypeptidase